MFQDADLAPSVWLGWLGWACSHYFIFTIFGEINKWRACRLFLKTYVEHFLCFITPNLVHSVWVGWLGWACSHFLVFTIVLEINKWQAFRVFKKQVLSISAV